MEKIHSINPERIKWCCADLGIAPGTLAAELGIAQASIGRVMEGRDGLTFKQLKQLADYFGRGVLFFLEQAAVDASQIHTAAFRTLANQKPELSAKLKTLIERVEQQRTIYLGLREEMEESGMPLFAAPEMAQADPRGAADLARAWLGLGCQNTFDAYRAAVEARGILVFRSNGYHGKWQIAKDNPILGFTLYHPSCPVIVVKKQDAESRQTFTLMHELGHILLHRASSIDEEADLQSRQGCESEANAFAGHVLVPDEVLVSIHDAARPADVAGYDHWLEAPRKATGVSGEVILRRLLDAGRLSQAQYAAYRQWRAGLAATASEGGSRAFRHREPKHIFGDNFVRMVLDALSGRHITLAKASAYLDGLKINDLQQLARHYASA